MVTGTPSGVASFMKIPAWLEDRDVVEVEIGKNASLKNEMVIET
jgi:2-keto-4-pentenoate hydratase/2-oxohepta-3-ene-1,7-dioic acid hydratase in catechol pathway